MWYKTENILSDTSYDPAFFSIVYFSICKVLQTVQHIQEKIEEECDLMDYEGSRLYDEYPDKYMIYHLSCKIRESMEPEISTQAIREDFLDELIQVMLCQEISRRRCRRYRCRRYF